MKMISTPTPVAANQYTGYIHNCLRNRACEPSYSAPVPGIPYLQLYVNFGTTKPIAAEFELYDHCGVAGTEQIFPSNYVIGQDPDGNWYGVFKNFNTPVANITTFIVWLSAIVNTPSGFQEKTFFSEMLVIEPCAPLTKIKACQPENATITAFDVNGLYYGLPQNVDYLGIAGVRYFHIAYVRNAKLRELSNKATFKSSLTRNFRTEFERIEQFDTELVPKWYKDVLLAIYLRGAISVNDGDPHIVSDLVFEPINDDDLTWKPYVQVKETVKLYFGCDESACVECCAPTITSAVSAGGEEGNTITIEFNGCEPSPSNGFKVFYRPIGSEIDYRESENFTVSPAVINDTLDQEGTEYEGYMVGDCAGSYGPSVPFDTEVGSGSGSGSGSISEGSQSSGFPELINGRISFICEDAAFAIMDIQFNGVSVDPVSGSLPMLSTDPPLEFYVTNPALAGTLKVIFDTPDAGVISIHGVDTSEQISCIDGIEPAFLELTMFDVENAGTVPFEIEVFCGACP
jgi:hypothetical protein